MTLTEPPLLSAEALEKQLRAVGEERYHHQHPFHRLMHEGKLTRGQLQAWAFNRYYNQKTIPIKDALILARSESPEFRRAWRKRIVDHDGEPGTPGGIGVYTVSVPEQSLAPLSTITGTWGQLTVGGTVTGAFPLGALLSGTAVPTGATIAANATNGVSLTGTGGAGTYVTQTATASSGTLTAATDFQTKFLARSSGQPGELVKMSSTAFG